MERELTLLVEILRLEREATHELVQLNELCVYPTAELAIIRKEWKSIKELYGSDDTGSSSPSPGAGGDQAIALAQLEAEVKFLYRKLQLLEQKRIEETERMETLERRQVKAKLKKEQQAKDPMNFNHARYQH